MSEGVGDQRDCARLGGSSPRSDVKQRSMELPMVGCAAAAAAAAGAAAAAAGAAAAAAAGAAAREAPLLGMSRGGGLHLLLLCWMLSAQPVAHGKCVFLLAACVCARACVSARVCGWRRPGSHIVARPCPCCVYPIPACVRACPSVYVQKGFSFQELLLSLRYRCRWLTGCDRAGY